MANPGTTEASEWPGTLLAVYEEHDTAEEVARTVIDTGVDPADVHLDQSVDATESLVAEMQEEVNRAIVAPPVGVAYPREASKSLLVVGLPMVAFFVVICLPLALFPVGGMVWWTRLLLAVVVGALSGSAVAFVVGPAIGARRANEPLAAHRGTVLRVDHATSAAMTLMADAKPIRMDHIDEGGAVMEATPVTTEDLTSGDGVLDEIHHNLDEIRRNTTDPKHENDPGYPAGDPPPEDDET